MCFFLIFFQGHRGIGMRKNLFLGKDIACRMDGGEVGCKALIVLGVRSLGSQAETEDILVDCNTVSHILYCFRQIMEKNF